MRNTITEPVLEAAAEALAELKAKPRPLGHLATGHSDSTVRRALALMRESGAPITFDRGHRVWRIDGADWVLPPHLMTRAALERAVESLPTRPHPVPMPAAPEWLERRVDDAVKKTAKRSTVVYKRGDPAENCAACGRPVAVQR